MVKGVVWGTDKGTPATEDGKPDGKPKMHPDGTPVWLSAPGDKRKRADRIGEHMSWQLLEEMKEWEPQTDTLLHANPDHRRRGAQDLPRSDGGAESVATGVAEKSGLELSRASL